MGQQANETKPIKCICAGLLAHVDAGKTTVTEQLLLFGGAIREAGSVDNGTARTDSLPVERQRGISVRTACACFMHNGARIQLIDTPGHVDFAGEVERSLSVLDGAVLVISAAEGVQAQTQVIYRALRTLAIPVLILVNKIDRAGCDIHAVTDQITENLTGNLVYLETADQVGSADCTVSELLPDSLEEEILAAIAERIPEYEDRYLAGERVSREELAEALAVLTGKGAVVPVLFSSAKSGVGIRQLAEAIFAFLPAADGNSRGELCGTVFQIEHDRMLGKAAYVRLFSGALHTRDLVLLPGKKDPEKISLIRREDGVKRVDVQEITGGEVGILYGLSGIRNGDVIGRQGSGRRVSITVPLMMVQAYAAREEETAALMRALTELSDEEPLLDYVYNQETRQMHLKITGTIQLEILKELLQSRYGLDAEFSKPSVLYRERPAGRGEGFEAYTMPKPCWAVVRLAIEPGEKGSGVRFQSAVKEGTLPRRYQHHVETSVYQTLKQGIYGFEVTDALVTLTYGEYHNVHTHPMDFFVATPIAVLRALTDSGSRLLEPYVRLILSAGEEYLGRVLGDITAMRGEFDTPVIRSGQFMLETIVPVADSMEYPIRFRSLTSGKGTISQSFHDYLPCRPGFEARLPRRGVDPLDRAKWILYVRNAFGNEQER